MKILFIVAIFALNFSFTKSGEPAPADSSAKLIILGSGNPNPDPEHSGCSVAVVVNGMAYIVDFGPGLIRRAAALTPRYGGNISALEAQNLNVAFLTHLHSDHTIGYPDLIFTPWVMGRNKALEVYGPEGIKPMTENILKAYKEDIGYRIYGSEPANDSGWRVNARDVFEGVVYRDSNVIVEAFPVSHGTWPNAYGYRFTTQDKVIVISGDTRPCDNILKYAAGADILLHEVYYKKGFDIKPPVWKAYHAEHHTSAVELGEIASKTKPKLLVYYHTLYWGGSDEDIINEIKETFDGQIMAGKDLGIY